MQVCLHQPLIDDGSDPLRNTHAVSNSLSSMQHWETFDVHEFQA